MMGLECPSPGISTRHSKPELLPAAGSTFQFARVGQPSATPRAPGPRNSGQCCSGSNASVTADLETSATAGKAVNVVVRNERRESDMGVLLFILSCHLHLR